MLKAKETGKFVQFHETFLDRLTQMPKTMRSYCAYIGGEAFAYLALDVTKQEHLEEELKRHQSELEQKIAGFDL